MRSHDKLMATIYCCTRLLAAILTCSMVLSCSVISEMVSRPPPAVPREGEPPRCALVVRFFVAAVELFIFVLRFYLVRPWFVSQAAKHSNAYGTIRL